jgi:hypothetical protein
MSAVVIWDEEQEPQDCHLHSEEVEVEEKKHPYDDYNLLLYQDRQQTDRNNPL